MHNVKTIVYFSFLLTFWAHASENPSILPQQQNYLPDESIEQLVKEAFKTKDCTQLVHLINSGQIHPNFSFQAVKRKTFPDQVFIGKLVSCACRELARPCIPAFASTFRKETIVYHLEKNKNWASVAKDNKVHLLLTPYNNSHLPSK